MIKKNRGR